jgi:hypothetical protein
MTGTGFYNATADRFVLDVNTTGSWKCDLKYDCKGKGSRSLANVTVKSSMPINLTKIISGTLSPI